MKNNKQWLHFIGIKGVGMSALAIVAQGLGYSITGSDMAEEFITDSSLKEAGIMPQEGFDAAHISPDIDVAVLGTAFGPDNPEIAKVIELNLNYKTYSEMLGEVSKQKQTIAVAGTHGKTTTTSLLAYLLYTADLNPSWVIGTGHVAGLPSHGYAGVGDYFVTEADDYKRAANDPLPKFLDLSPFAAIITSIEHDHPDLYPTLQDCVTAFAQFITKVTHPQGFLAVNGDDPNIQLLIQKFPEQRFVTYGFNDGVDWQIIQEEPPTDVKAGFSLFHNGETVGPFYYTLSGKHNAYNTAAAVVTALEIGVPIDAIQENLPEFQAVERRYQLLGQVGEQVVIDDYAHHPTSVRLTLEAAQNQFPTQPLWCIFQPHTFSRTQALLKEFGEAFEFADDVIITDIFASARETSGDITAQDLANEIAKHQPNVHYVPKDELLSYMKANIPPKATVITMGAGDIYKIGQAFVSQQE